MAVWFAWSVVLVHISTSAALSVDKPSVCSFNPLFLEGTCSAHYTDPAAVQIEGVFLTLAEADCELANPCSYPPQYTPRDWEEFDFIVVGAGSAGAVVANRLSEISGWTVLLLEAGGDPTKTSEVPGFNGLLQLTELDWQYKTDSEEPNCLGYEGNQCNWPRGKVLGGSSTINAMIYKRGNRVDYDGWEAEGNVGWGYRDVLPYFKKSEDMRSMCVQSIPDFMTYHGIGGPLKVEDFYVDPRDILPDIFQEGFAELGYPFNPDDIGRFQSGFCRKRGTIQDGRRCSTAKAFLSTIVRRNNLKVSKHSLVTKILIDEVRKTAYGVEFVDNRGKLVRVLARKEVIVSGGAINSPQLLMLSGIGPRNHLFELGINVIADLPVGENLQDQPLGLGLILALDYFVPPADPERDMFDFLLKYSNRISSQGINGFNVFIDTENRGVDVPDVQIYFFSYPKNSTGLARYLQNLGVREEISRQIIEINSHSYIVLLRPAILVPYSRGLIRIQSTNPMQYPDIITGYFTDSRDIDTLSRAIDILYKFAETEAVRSAGGRLYEVRIDTCTRFPFASRAYRECFLRHLTNTIYHPVGTCRMGPPGCRNSVVDPALRVKGVAKLRVVDASVMPLIVRGTTNPPAIMIGEKGADLIKDAWLRTYASEIDRFRHLFSFSE